MVEPTTRGRQAGRGYPQCVVPSDPISVYTIYEKIKF